MQVEERNFGRLLIEFQPQIYGYIRSFIPHECDAEEVFQEVASVLWKKFDDFQAGTSFLAWALSVARYEVMYFWRKQSRDLLWFDDDLLDNVADDTVAVSSQAEEMHAALKGCISKLTPRQKDLIQHRYQTSTSVIKLAK
ncbi:MAG: sigma-70 family RNA polymerase sigma factor, partial [Planctomycetia bacterium]